MTKTEDAMNRFLILSFCLSLFAVSFTSCSKDEEAPEWSFLYGEWMPAGKCDRRMAYLLGYETTYNRTPSQVRLTFDSSGKMTFYQPESKTDELPWDNGTFSYQVKNIKGDFYLTHDGEKAHEVSDSGAHIWYIPEEDALYYNYKGLCFNIDEKGEKHSYEVDMDYIFKRATEENMHLSIQDRDKNVDLKAVSEMPEWMQKWVSYQESAPYEFVQNFEAARRIHEFKYKGQTFYRRYWELGRWGYYTEKGEIVDDTNSLINFNLNLYAVTWFTTDWKLIYIFP